jgi:FkbM family methyltransferase
MGGDRDLVVDVGMHTGEDTRRFLAAGHRVVAVEANPELVQAASRTFADELRDGRLTIVSAAISDERGTVSLGISDQTIWSSLDPSMIARNERLAGSSYRYVDVRAIRFEDVLDEFGVPYYLKVDIEGLDMLCVRALRNFQERPTFVSIESNVSVNQAPAGAVRDEISELWRLGYRRFRYVNQRHGENPVPTPDSWDGPSWSSISRTITTAQGLRINHNLVGFGGRWVNSRLGQAYRMFYRQEPPWWDLHAALPS